MNDPVRINKETKRPEKPVAVLITANYDLHIIADYPCSGKTANEIVKLAEKMDQRHTNNWVEYLWRNGDRTLA